MMRKFFLVLLFTIITGIQPALAQSKKEAPAKPAVPEKPVKEGETVININLASDKDFTKALEAAADVELVNENPPAATATSSNNTKSDNNTNQGKTNDKK
jgi:hypothetical protein